MERRTDAAADEANFGRIDVVMLHIDDARERAERAASALRHDGAPAHLAEALERAAAELSDVARRLRQGTFFATP